MAHQRALLRYLCFQIHMATATMPRTIKTVTSVMLTVTAANILPLYPTLNWVTHKWSGQGESNSHRLFGKQRHYHYVMPAWCLRKESNFRTGFRKAGSVIQRRKRGARCRNRTCSSPSCHDGAFPFCSACLGWARGIEPPLVGTQPTVHDLYTTLTVNSVRFERTLVQALILLPLPLGYES